MHTQEISIEVPSQGARRATGEGSQNGWKKPERFSARHKTEVVLRLLRGEALDLLSREIGIPSARIATVSLADYAKSLANRPWKLSCCMRRLAGLRPAAL